MMINCLFSSLPPIGVFWDIENCQVPKGKSAVAVAQAIRETFFQGYQETEFLVVCDVKKENAQVIHELNDAQVTVAHVSSQSKNAADDKLRQAIRRFAEIHDSQAAVILISSDINFSPDLCYLKHRKKIHVILLYNNLCSHSLISYSHEHHNYLKFVESLPLRSLQNVQSKNVVIEVLVTNLPSDYDGHKIRKRLKRLSANCGGRVGIVANQKAKIRFATMEIAARARKRMKKERVFGNYVFVSRPYTYTYPHTDSVIKSDAPIDTRPSPQLSEKIHIDNDSSKNKTLSSTFKRYGPRRFKIYTSKKIRVVCQSHAEMVIPDGFRGIRIIEI